MSGVDSKLQGVEIGYRQAFEYAADAFCILDARGRVLFMNSAALALSGKSWENIQGRNLEEAFPSDILDKCVALFSRACETKEQQVFRALQKLPNGRERNQLIAFLPQLNENGGLGQVISVVKSGSDAGLATPLADLALQEDAKRWLDSSLKSYELRLRMACQAAHVCTWEWNRGDSFARASQDLFSWLGIPCSSDECITLNCFLSGVHPEDRQRMSEAARNIMKTQDTRSFEFRLVRPDGSIRWVASYYQPVIDSEGHLEGLLGLIQDISDRKKGEEALRQLNETLEKKVAERTEEVVRQAGQLRALTAELTKAEQSERKRLASILHDHVQQLLVAAGMQIDIALHSAVTEQIQTLLDSAKNILDEAVQDLRSLSVELCPPILHYSGLAAALAWLAKRIEHQHHFQVKVQLDERANPELEAIRFLLFECVRELLLNSIKHSGATEAQVGLSLADNGWIQIQVTDQGRGFDAAQLLTNGYGSVGFGLFSIEQRLAYLGGRIHIDSSPDQGVRITLIVPSALLS